MAVPPVSTPVYEGIDVSQWQGSINFSQVRDSGIELVYIKSSEGFRFIEPNFERYYEDAKAAGLSVGFYHYLTARSAGQARQQAHFFMSTIQGNEADLRPALDFELLDGLSDEEISEISRAFLTELSGRLKENGVIYGSVSKLKRLDPALSVYPVWVAQYGVPSPEDAGPWEAWTGWQYTNRGRVNGIRTNVDRNRFTKEIYLNEITVMPDPGNPPFPTTQILTYRIKKGDTLSRIARLYHITVAALASFNQISDPDRIYAGETLKIPLDSAGSDESAYRFYTIQRGDTLSAIAKRYKTTVKELAELNRIPDPNRIYPGQILKIAR